jgi:hypothetical protein
LCESSDGAPLVCNLIGQKYVSICFPGGAINQLIPIICLNPGLWWY